MIDKHKAPASPRRRVLAAFSVRAAVAWLVVFAVTLGVGLVWIDMTDSDAAPTISARWIDMAQSGVEQPDLAVWADVARSGVDSADFAAWIDMARFDVGSADFASWIDMTWVDVDPTWSAV